MLFMCHQMAMERDAKIKKQQNSSRTPSAPSTPIYETSEPPLVQDSKVPIIWVLGGPGSGKGTQCERIVEKYHFQHFSTGDLLRAEVDSGSAKGKELQEIMKTGALVSNEAVLGLLQQAMNNTKGAVGFLVDGYPREKDQGIAFEKTIAPVDIILYFECSDDTMVARISHRASQAAVVRADDNLDAIKIRIATFRKNTNEILVQYPSKLRTINVERPVDEIFADVSKAIDDCLAKK